MKNLLLLVFATCVITACNNDKSAAQQTADNIKKTMDATSPKSSMPAGAIFKATIDGKDWEAASITPGLDARSSYTYVNGENGETIINFQLWKPTAGKKIELGENHVINFFNEDGIWSGNKGEIVITRADREWLEGTFQFTATSSSADGSYEIRNGVFKVPAKPEAN